MPSLVPAAQQLIQQVQNLNPKATVKAVGEPDGFGRLRSVEFDARTSKWLADVLAAVNDNRIAAVNYQGKGRAIVTFVGDTRADVRTEYPFRDALRVLEGRD